MGSDDLAWQADAYCAGLDVNTFFPEKGESAEPAKRICARCDVVEECLAYATDNDVWFGVWGSLSENERRVLRRRQVHIQGWPRVCLACGTQFAAANMWQRCCSDQCSAARHAQTKCEWGRLRRGVN